MANTAEVERDAWIETASQNQRNTDYYRGLVEEIGSHFGEAAYISDDDSVQEDILCAKVPELVAALKAEWDRQQEALGGVVENLALGGAVNVGGKEALRIARVALGLEVEDE